MLRDASGEERKAIEVVEMKTGISFTPNEGHCMVISYTVWVLDPWWKTIRDLMLAGF